MMIKQTRPIFARLVIWTMLALLLGACSVLNANLGPEVQPTDEPIVPQTAPTSAPAETPTAEHTEKIQTGEGLLYQDDFSDTTSGWPESVTFDNYFIGYHEPSYYHVEVHAPYDKAVVAVPKAAASSAFSDFTLESAVFTEPNNTAPEGGFRYGLILRRSGGQYYAFTVSPRDQTWQFLKVSPSSTEELNSGSDDSIQGLSSDTLRVDASGADFVLSINDRVIGEASDSDYASGEVGFYVETLDVPRVHVHFDTLVVRELELATENQGLLYTEDFVDTTSGWPESVAFDNYFIGYHEPSYYHVEVHAPYDRAVIALPKVALQEAAAETGFSDLTIESKVFTEPNNTAPEGGFRYGVILRRSGGQYYAFTVAPRDQTWQFLKVTPSSTEELNSGSDDTIQGLSSDTLRVDAVGENFSLWINEELVGEASDSDYTSGDVGFYVETLDNPRVHVHFDTLTLREAEAPQEETHQEEPVDAHTSNVSCTIVAAVADLLGTSDPAVIDAAQVDQAFEAVARSYDDQWLKVNLEGISEPMWVPNSTDFFTCEGDLSALPIETP